MKKSEENFPIKPKKDIIREQMARGPRTIDDLSEKEKSYFQRLYPFTPRGALCKKFGIDDKIHDQLIHKFREEGINLRKNESYSRTAANPDPQNEVAVNNEPVGFFLSSFMNTLSEEERREMVQMAEEGIEPVTMMEHLIAVQSKRILRGWQMEKDGPNLHRTTNEAVHDITIMISKLHEMKEGVKKVHGFDDSFVGLLLSLNQNKRKEKENWME